VSGKATNHLDWQGEGPGAEPGAPLPRRSRAPQSTVWVNGRLCRGAEAALTIFDRGARDGEGLFETVRVERRQPLLWAQHLERMAVAAAELGFPVPPSPATLAEALGRVLEANDLTDAAARITVTRGVPGTRPTYAGCWIEAQALDVRLWRGTRRDGVALIYSKVPFSPGAFGRFKTTARLPYSLAREEARAARADEALLVSPAGEVLEGAVSNVFAVAGGEVLTPPREAGILPGIVREQVLQACGTLGLLAREIALSRNDLAAADEVFVTNAVQQVVPAASLAGRAVPQRSVAMRLAEACRAQCRSAVR